MSVRLDAADRDRPILERFQRLTREEPQRLAIHSLSECRTLTFTELATEYEAFRRVFEQARLPRRTCIISRAGNRTATVAIFLACLDLDLVCLLLERDATASEASQLAARYRASAMVAPESKPPETMMSSDGVYDLPDALHLVRLPEPSEPPDFADAALMKLTSGSEEGPRGVLTSELQLWNDGRHIVEAMDIRREDINLGIIPLSHSYGFGNLALPLLLQGTTLVLRSSFLPEALAADLASFRVTVLPGVPYVFDHLVQQPKTYPLPTSMRLMLTAGAAIQPETVAAFKERFGLKIHSFYGASETGGISYDDSEELEEPASVGKPMPETEVFIEPFGEQVPGEEGRILVRGNAVASGYLLDDLTRESSDFVGGAFRTGDLGRLDEKGRIFLTGRISSFVNIAGSKVNPAETERVLLQMGQISAATVFGMRCEKRGQKLVACIVPRDETLSVASVRAFCASRLSSHRIPREFIFVDELPVNARGKIERESLEKLVTSSSSGQDASPRTD